MSSEVKIQNLKKGAILSEIYFLYITSCLSQVIGIQNVFSRVNCKLNILWIYIIFLSLEGPSCSFGFGMPVQTHQFKGWARLQYRQNSVVERLRLEKPPGICNFFGSSLKNRINHACPLQKGVTHICQWPLDPLGLRSTSKDHHSFSKVHTGFLVWCCSALKSDSANKTFLKRTNTDKLLSTIKGLLFSMVDVSSSGWRFNSTVLR